MPSPAEGRVAATAEAQMSHCNIQTPNNQILLVEHLESLYWESHQNTNN